MVRAGAITSNSDSPDRPSAKPRPTPRARARESASAGAIAAMKKGSIDAISNLDPVITKLETDGDIVVVADTRTAKGMKEVYGGEYHAGCIYAPRSSRWILLKD